MEVLAYVRVSTEEQADKGNSMFEQQERIQAYCKAMDWPEPEFFIDDGASAKNINRKQLTRLLNKVKMNDKSGIVITTKLDRLSRRLFDILTLIDFFDEHKFKYVSQSEGFDTASLSGRLVMQMLGMVAEFERERTSERVKENMLSIARRKAKRSEKAHEAAQQEKMQYISEEDLKTISRPPFGYEVINGVMTPNPEQASIIKQMYEWALKGEGARAIAGKLNALGIKTKQGNTWHDKVVRQFLQRETIKGQFTYNKTYKVDGKVFTRPESEWVVAKNNHEAIIDPETFERVCDFFKARKTVGKHVDNTTFILSGLVYCKHCGEKMNGKTNRNYSKKLKRENVRYQYLCNGYLKKKLCYHHFIERDAIENLVLNSIKNIQDAVPGTLQLNTVKVEAQEINVETLQSKLEALDARMQKQIDAYNDDLISAADLKKASERVNIQREEIYKMIEESNTDNTAKLQQHLQEKAIKKSSDFASDDRVRIKAAIRNLIDHIEVEDGEAVSIFWHAH